jgi:predicted acyl esterase
VIIDRDVAIEMDDGAVLRADVFRPDTHEPVPVIMTLGPYGKGVQFQDGYRAQWEWLIGKHPHLSPGSTHSLLTWETVDPEIWVGWGYAVVRVDSRGAGRSPGLLDIFSPRETRDYYLAIEWAGTQAWSSGRVGLNGISYFAVNQWLVASLQPPHLAAIIPWEGAADFYRDWARHGGIANTDFMEIWYPRQILRVQHGNPDAPTDRWLNQSAAGPEMLTAQERADNRTEPVNDIIQRPLDGPYYRDRSPDFSRVTVPLLSCASWAGFGLHPRGNFEGFTQAASQHKWLDAHSGRHEEWFYLDYGLDIQRRFLDCFLKGEDNGWLTEPPVWLNIRRPFTEEVTLRKEAEWPLARTSWTPLFLSANDGSLGSDAPSDGGVVSFDAAGDPVLFRSAPLPDDMEITGPVSVRIWVSSSTIDADLFVTLLAFAPDGREVEFQGTLDPHTPLAQGCLRASQRKLDPTRSLPYRPFHPHDESWPLTPGEVYELNIELWPTCIALPAGYQVALQISGHDFEREVPPDDPNTMWTSRGSGPYLHTNPIDRPRETFAGHTTIHTDPAHPTRVLLPIIPPR